MMLLVDPGSVSKSLSNKVFSHLATDYFFLDATKIVEYNLKQRTVSRLGLIHQWNLDNDLSNIFRVFDAASKLANILYSDSEIDKKF
jgi:hypothetical protein